MTDEIVDTELWEGGNLIGDAAKLSNEIFKLSREDVLADISASQKQLAVNDNEGGRYYDLIGDKKELEGLYK